MKVLAPLRPGIGHSTPRSDEVREACGVDSGCGSSGALIPKVAGNSMAAANAVGADDFNQGDPAVAFASCLGEQGVAADVSERKHASSIATDAEARESDGEWLTTPAISKTNFQDFRERDCIGGGTRQCAFSIVETLLSHRGPYYPVIADDFHNRNPPVSDAFSFRKEREARYVSEWKHAASLAMPISGSVG